MEFEFKYTLPRGQEITVTVDAAGSDCLISLCLPYSFGVSLERLFDDLTQEQEKIERAAWEEYRERVATDYEPEGLP